VVSILTPLVILSLQGGKMYKKIIFFLFRIFVTIIRFCFVCIVILFFLVLFLHTHPAGTDSERSFSGRESHRRLLRQSVAGGGGSITNGGIGYNPVKPMKIAAINGKPKVTRYLSKECKFLFYFYCTVFWLGACWLFVFVFAHFLHALKVTRMCLKKNFPSKKDTGTGSMSTSFLVVLI
jgi:hypothetical protein